MCEGKGGGEGGEGRQLAGDLNGSRQILKEKIAELESVGGKLLFIGRLTSQQQAGTAH